MNSDLTGIKNRKPALCVLLLAFLLQVSCGSGDSRSFSSTTGEISSIEASPVLLAPASATGCEEIGRKRIVRLFYLWPANTQKEEELKPTTLPARRYRTEVTAADLGWSFLGFMLGVVTETSVVEACDSRFVLRDRSIGETPTLVRSENHTPSPAIDFPNLLVNAQRSRATFSVYFAAGSSVLAAVEKERLVRMAAELKSKPATKLIIIGHADRTGEERKNYMLSRERARVVRELLIEAGLSSQVLIPVAAGSSWPVADIPYYAMSRRTEIVIFREDGHEAP